MLRPVINWRLGKSVASGAVSRTLTWMLRLTSVMRQYQPPSSPDQSIAWPRSPCMCGSSHTLLPGGHTALYLEAFGKMGERWAVDYYHTFLVYRTGVQLKSALPKLLCHRGPGPVPTTLSHNQHAVDGCVSVYYAVGVGPRHMTRSSYGWYWD